MDIQWYQPTATGHDYKEGAKLAMDEFSRLASAPEKFASSKGGQGFKPLADYVHAKGLKLGIQMMHGICRQAAKQNTPDQGYECPRRRHRFDTEYLPLESRHVWREYE